MCNHCGQETMNPFCLVYLLTADGREQHVRVPEMYRTWGCLVQDLLARPAGWYRRLHVVRRAVLRARVALAEQRANELHRASLPADAVHPTSRSQYPADIATSLQTRKVHPRASAEANAKGTFVPEGADGSAYVAIVKENEQKRSESPVSHVGEKRAADDNSEFSRVTVGHELVGHQPVTAIALETELHLDGSIRVLRTWHSRGQQQLRSGVVGSVIGEIGTVGRRRLADTLRRASERTSLAGSHSP